MDQRPKDLGANAEVLDSRKLEITPLYLNPNDGFTLCAVGVTENRPDHYRRIRGTHELFEEARHAPTVAVETPHASTNTIATLAVTILVAVGSGIVLFGDLIIRAASVLK